MIYHATISNLPLCCGGRFFVSDGLGGGTLFVGDERSNFDPNS